MTISKNLIEEQYQIALSEIGEINPVYADDSETWTFDHPLYDLEGEGASLEECIKTYQRWLKIFIIERLNGNLAANVELRTSGRGGARLGAGRPKGSLKAPTKMVRVPVDFANWIKANPENLEKALRLMAS